MILNEVELQDCPICHGAGLMVEEYGWCVYATCLDCDVHTVEIAFKNEEQKKEAVRKSAQLWNEGKVICSCPNE